MEEHDENFYSRLDSYSYDLPEELIAQNPVEPRDSSRLLSMSRASGAVVHKTFSDLPELLRAGDLLVMNDTRVFRARLRGEKIPGGAKVEVLCLDGGDGVWRALVRPGRKLPPGTEVRLADGTVIVIGERIEDGLRRVRFPSGVSDGEIFARDGAIPLPPYITRSTAPDERYQTIYAKRENERSAASPTAGLHFTEELFGSLDAMGVERAFITLHVGLGTFRPVMVEDVRDHVMHEEFCQISSGVAEKIAAAKSRGGRVIAVGTTVVRTLESFADENGNIAPGTSRTRLFIRPGFTFRVVDGLITNFHLPGSTLLMLVAAFAGYENTMRAYRIAVEERYRFFSFGDSMAIL